MNPNNDTKATEDDYALDAFGVAMLREAANATGHFEAFPEKARRLVLKCADEIEQLRARLQSEREWQVKRNEQWRSIQQAVAELVV